MAQDRQLRHEPQSTKGEDWCLWVIEKNGMKNGFSEFERHLRLTPDPQQVERIVEGFLQHEYPRPYELYKCLPDGDLKQRLTFEFLERGIIPLESQEASEGKKYVVKQAREDPTLKAVADADMPEVLQAWILTVEKFGNIHDPHELQKYFSYTVSAFLSEHLGTLSGPVQRREWTIWDKLDLIPPKIFKNPELAAYNLAVHYVQQGIMGVITDEGLQSGLDILEEQAATQQDSDKRQFLEDTCARFYDIATRQYSDKFKPQIKVKGEFKNFPSFEQMAFCYQASEEGTRVFLAKPGLGKTGGGYEFMENTDAEKVLVLVPASGKQTWEDQERVLFKEPGNVFVVQGSKDLDDPRVLSKKYVVMSMELLKDTEHDPELGRKIKDIIIDRAKTDGAVLDEIHNLSNPNTYTTKAARALIGGIRANYEAKTGKAQGEAPVVGLTATLIKSGLSDLNVPLAMLYPDDFAATREEATKAKKTFSDTCLNQEEIVFTKLVGEKKVFLWESATGVQDLEVEPEMVDVSPFELYLYEFIGEKLAIDPLNKIRLMEDALLNPLLIRGEVRMLIDPKDLPLTDIDSAVDTLKKLVVNWQNMIKLDELETDADYLSADRIVELGLGDLVLACFFDPLTIDPNSPLDGIDYLVDEYTKKTDDPQLLLLRKFWKNHGLSAKYKRAQELMKEALENNMKTFIISPTKRQGRTGDVLQRKIEGSDGNEENLYAEYELDRINDTTLVKLIPQWTGREPLVIDGTVPVGAARNRQIARWLSPDEKFLLGTLQANMQSRDYSPTDIIDSQGRQIAGILNLHLGWPWNSHQLEQIGGRHTRQGQLVPSVNRVLEARDLLDSGKSNAVRFTRLMTRLALAGVRLSKEDREFYDSKKIGRRIDLQSKDSTFIRTALYYMRGAGEEEASVFMKRKDIDSEKTYAERFAERFFNEGRDEYQVTGYNAEMVVHLINNLGLAHQRALSLGAGTLLFQRKLKKPVDNVDLNTHMMDVAWPQAQEFGGTKTVAHISSLDPKKFPDESYDFVDIGFTLHWSKLGDSLKPDSENYSERVKILKQIHRVLKLGGTLALTVPESAFEEEDETGKPDERFFNFVRTLEDHFGFRIDRQFTGKSFGISEVGARKRLGWCIFAYKEREIDLSDVSLKNLEFAYDKKRWVSVYQKQKGKDKPSIHPTDFPDPTMEVIYDQYEIVNPDQKVSVIYTSGSPISPVTDITPDTQSDENIPDEGESVIIHPDESLTFLRGYSEEDYNAYRRNLIRPIRRITGWNWNQVEEFAMSVMDLVRSNEGKLPPNRLVAFSWIINEARSQARMGQLGNLPSSK